MGRGCRKVKGVSPSHALMDDWTLGSSMEPLGNPGELPGPELFNCSKSLSPCHVLDGRPQKEAEAGQSNLYSTRKM